MARADNDYGFTAIRVEGGLLPPEYLQTINALQATHQASTDYGLTRSLNIKDEIGRYWRMATDLWADYQVRRQRTDLDPVRVAIDEWLLPLFEHILGYHDITPCMPVTIGERHFPVGHKACGKTVPLLWTGHIYDLDKAELRFGDAGRRRPPYGLLQEYLNADDACLWGMVSNGNLVRLARDNPSLTRPAFIEADLERMFEEQLFADFAAFWLLLHVSRVAPRNGIPAQCLLEAWRTESLETGERARAKLRLGVTIALRQLGNGFLEQQANDGLRQALSTGEITETGYYQELLRLVYRLLFLFTVEDRDLLFHPEASGEAQRLYAEGYALSRLRDRALRRRHYDQHGDLWDGLRVVFRGLAKGVEPFGLPALGGLFADDQCPQLDACAITNDRLLQAIRALAFFDSGKSLARVNYRDMGTEELGSVYESLLEQHPTITVAPWTFGFIGDGEEKNIRGSERKISGSYYTPPVLVDELIKSALLPVIEHTLKDDPVRPRDALLGLKIVDPACGSGHFLLAAARQVATELARLDAGADTPGEALRQHALREVVQHCIYGVDRNPLAVELCKTALWIETVEPGKPLSFLDSHIRCGDSLVGILDPKMMEDGIPDEAYGPLAGDDKTVANALKRRNQQGERSVQGSLFDPEGLKPLAVVSFDLNVMPEDTVEEIEVKRQAWNQVQEDHALQQQTLRADLFVGAFFTSKTTENAEKVPLTEDLNRLSQGLPQRPGLIAAIKALAQRHGFFHWSLAFPDVFADGGFDVILSNPPWERVKLQEQEFFAARDARIANASTKAARAKLIKELLQTNPMLHQEFVEALRAAASVSTIMRHSGRFPLAGRGDINTYAVFAEFAAAATKPQGRAGLILPTGIATDDTTKLFFSSLIKTGRLIDLIGFENEEFIFPAVHHAFKFCKITIGGGAHIAEYSRIGFYIRKFVQLSEEQRFFSLDKSDFSLLNPNTGNCPIFRTQADAELTKAVYRRVPVLWRETADGQPEENPWRLSFKTLFHMANDSHHFRTAEELEADSYRREGNVFVSPYDRYLPLYEAKMLHQFDHRFSTYEGATEKQLNVGILPQPTAEQKRDPSFMVQPRYWVREEVVESAIPKYPEPLALALQVDHRPSIQYVLTLWAAGFHLHRGDKKQAAELLHVATSANLDRAAAHALGAGTDEYHAKQLAQDFPLMEDDVQAIVGCLDTPESLARDLVERFSPKWFLGWRDITNSTNERTIIASAIPKAPIGHTFPLAFCSGIQPQTLVLLFANLNCLVADYIARQKVGGMHITYNLLKQFPILPPDCPFMGMPFALPHSSVLLQDWLLSRVLELTYTSHDLTPLAGDCGYDGPPFLWDDVRRFEIRCELDAVFFHLYLPCELHGSWRKTEGETLEQLIALKHHFPQPRDAVAYILDQFPIVRQKDERTYGSYRTKERILDIYDAMLAAQSGSQPYQTKLNPLPGSR